VQNTPDNTMLVTNTFQLDWFTHDTRSEFNICQHAVATVTMIVAVGIIKVT